MQRLPGNQVLLRKIDGTHVAVSAHESNGYRYWTKFALSDLPNDLISCDDLKRLGIQRIDCGSV